MSPLRLIVGQTGNRTTTFPWRRATCNSAQRTAQGRPYRLIIGVDPPMYKMSLMGLCSRESNLAARQRGVCAGTAGNKTRLSVGGWSHGCARAERTAIVKPFVWLRLTPPLACVHASLPRASKRLLRARRKHKGRTSACIPSPRTQHQTCNQPLPKDGLVASGDSSQVPALAYVRQVVGGFRRVVLGAAAAAAATNGGRVRKHLRG